MAKKFLIECPKCHAFQEASTGFFAKKILICSCGEKINVKENRLAAGICSHCGNHVIYDRTRGESALCPVCHERINTRESIQKLVQIPCPSCGCEVSVYKGEQHRISCPLCDAQINVDQLLAQKEIKDKGLASVIKYEGGNDTFVWKHPVEDFNLGSQLIVHESQQAVVFRNGLAEVFEPGRHTLTTANLPIIKDIINAPLNPDGVFHSEVYFINMTTQMGIKWGTDSKVRLFDPASGLHVEIGACGNFNLRVCDARTFLLRMVGTDKGFLQGEVMGTGTGLSNIGMKGKFKALVMNRVKANLARSIRDNQINILEIDSSMDLLSESLRDIINQSLEEYGLTMPEFYITTILTPDDDPNYRKLKQQFADKTLLVRDEEVKQAQAEAAQKRKITEKQTEVQLQLIGAQGDAESLKLKAQAEADAYRMQAMAEAAEMKAKGYTYQQETARMTGMEALKNGITGNGVSTMGTDLIGSMAGIGLGIGAMGSMVNMTKSALNPALDGMTSVGSGLAKSAEPQEAASETGEASGWTCPTCGTKGITTKFCPECGAKKPEPVRQETWDCPVCGMKGITTKFCPECGAKKPVSDTWDCPQCGTKGIKTKFCPECGAKRM